MALSEIEKLERRYAENPQGLTFAPSGQVHFVLDVMGYFR